MALSDWNEKQLLALTAGAVGGILLVMGALDAWVYRRYDALWDEIGVQRRNVDDLKRRADELEVKQGVHADEAAKAKKLQKRLPKDELMGDLIREIAGQARDAGIAFEDWERIAQKSSRRGGPKTKHTPIKLRLHLEGGYDSFGKFVSYLENHRRMDRFLKVTGFSVSAYKQGLIPGEEKLDISLDLMTYTHGRKTARAGR